MYKNLLKTGDYYGILHGLTKAVFGTEIGMFVKYIKIPNVELVSYLETIDLVKSSESKFSLLIKQTPESKEHMEVGGMGDMIFNAKDENQ